VGPSISRNSECITQMLSRTMSPNSAMGECSCGVMCRRVSVTGSRLLTLSVDE
jgi:hypothetical protein